MGLFDLFRRKVPGPVVGASAKRVVGGRPRVHGIPYLLPNDAEELNRLDFQHYMLRATLHGNYAAPIGSPSSILDVGTGTGRWAREMAITFPNANVVGVDVNLSPDDNASSRRTDDLRPPNYTFVQGNILEGLTFPDGSFDFVHQRALLAAITHDHWPQVARELTRLARPGGWVESLEVTELEQGGPATTQLVNWLRVVLARRGVEFADGGRVGEHLRQAGLANVQTQTIRMQCGDAGGRIGKMLAVDWFSLFDATGAFMVALGLTNQEELAQVMTVARKELAAPRGKCAMPVYITYGQRAK